MSPQALTSALALVLVASVASALPPTLPAGGVAYTPRPGLTIQLSQAGSDVRVQIWDTASDLTVAWHAVGFNSAASMAGTGLFLVPTDTSGGLTQYVAKGRSTPAELKWTDLGTVSSSQESSTTICDFRFPLSAIPSADAYLVWAIGSGAKFSYHADKGTVAVSNKWLDDTTQPSSTTTSTPQMADGFMTPPTTTPPPTTSTTTTGTTPPVTDGQSTPPSTPATTVPTPTPPTTSTTTAKVTSTSTTTSVSDDGSGSGDSVSTSSASTKGVSTVFSPTRTTVTSGSGMCTSRKSCETLKPGCEDNSCNCIGGECIYRSTTTSTTFQSTPATTTTTPPTDGSSTPLPITAAGTTKMSPSTTSAAALAGQNVQQPTVASAAPSSVVVGAVVGAIVCVMLLVGAVVLYKRQGSAGSRIYADDTFENPLFDEAEAGYLQVLGAGEEDTQA